VTDIVALAAAVTELLSHTRRARTALWCAVQMTSAETAAVTDNATRDPAVCIHANDNWRCSVPTSEPFDVAAPHKC